MEQLPFLNIFDPNILERYVACQVMVSNVDGHTSLIIAVVFIMLQDIDIFE